MSKFQSIPGLAEVELGETIESPSIKRVDVADGTKGRVIPLRQKWLAATVAFTDEPLKGSWFVDRDILLKYGLRGRVIYVCPVIRLNTDAKGQVLDSSFKIEYLRLGDTVYEKFAATATEMSNMHSIVCTSEKRGQYSYITPSPSNKNLSAKEVGFINEVINQVNSLGYDMDAICQLVMLDVARPFEAYLEMAKQKNIDVLPDEAPVQGALPPAFGNGGLLPGNTQESAQAEAPQIKTPQFGAPKVQQPAPQPMGGPKVEDADADEFNENDEFNEQ
jgi:hypothetical protein